MDYIYTLLRKYPNRIKYWILIIDVFAMIIAIRTYVNYISIETAIKNAIIEQQIKSNELAFSQNFLMPYEKSEYASYFLQHENNMLLRDEYIIKFEEMYKKQNIETWNSQSHIDYIQTTDTKSNTNNTNTPQQSWKKFILQKINN